MLPGLPKSEKTLSKEEKIEKLKEYIIACMAMGAIIDPEVIEYVENMNKIS
jgi:hypothetical protein